MKKRYILGMIFLSLIGLGMYAYAEILVDSSEVSFDNSNSNTDASTVQEAIEDLYSKLITHIIDLGTGTSFDVKSILESQGVNESDAFYQNLSANNFMMTNDDGTRYSSGGGPYVESAHWAYADVVKSYNASTFVLTYYIKVWGATIDAKNNKVHVYLVV